MMAGRFEQIEQVDLSGLTRSRLESFVAAVGELESFLASRRLEAMAAIDSLGDGGLSSDSVLRVRGKVASQTAKQAADTAKTLQAMPQTAARLAAGEITEAHVEANVAAAVRVDDPVAADEALNRSSVVAPADLHTKESSAWASKHENRDKALKRRERQRLNRRVGFGRVKDDGSWCLFAATDPGEGRELQGLVEQEADRLFRVEDGGRGGDTQRTRQQRMLDALAALIRRGAGVETTTTGGRSHPRFQPVLRFGVGEYLDDVEGELVGEGPLPDSVVNRILCESGLDVLLTAADGTPLWLGRSSRDVSTSQWRALIERDEGCVACGAEPSRCEAHHLVWWSRNGPTDITNLVLLCTKCHHDLHDRGHELIRIDNTWHLKPPNHNQTQHRRTPQQPRAA